MKKKIIKIIIVLIIIIMLVPISVKSAKKNLSFADAVVITDFYAENGPVTVELNQEQNSEEIKRLKELCVNNDIINDPFSIPACPFERFAVEFNGKDKSVTVYPCNDDCSTMLMAVNGKDCYYDISMNDKQELDELLEKIVGQSTKFNLQ